MKKTLLFLLVGVSLNAQSEFPEFDNSLIYSPEAIHRLQEIVGDKNEEFRKCDLTKDFVSIPQAKGFYFNIKNRSRTKIVKDIKEGISLEDFKLKYDNLDTELSLITKREYIDYKNNSIVSITEMPDENSIKIKLENWGKSKMGNWIVKAQRGNKNVIVVYIQEEFKTLKLPYKYSRMIQYAECMVDTTTRIHLKEKKHFKRYDWDEILNERNAFYKYIDQQFKIEKPVLSDEISEIEDYIEMIATEEYKTFNKDKEEWEELRSNFIRDSLSKQPYFIELINKAYEEAFEKQHSNDIFEDYISKYLSKEKALKLKRSRVVVGMCSQDQSPRIHAMNIAQLSAESYNWNVFLRAHLNIMNDRFQRAADGSYAWKSRNTYIKELEVLNIDVPPLIYGITLRIDNPSKNHYYGSIRRIGRAIAESQDKDKIQSELIDMIKDNSLDDYNRVLVFYLYYNLQYNLDHDYDKAKIKPITALLPKHLIPKI
ncbi:hypothetical protein [Aquimarina sp. AU119]|uniref:hypothetical protein n=1 Tax=Aquimarina sp. AU119 TaxID=2108528 RepID=UPI000D6962FA|nr:hypothetical protein [Aquimarina sp. AU119]